jgi:hypothetical protein
MATGRGGVRPRGRHPPTRLPASGPAEPRTAAGPACPGRRARPHGARTTVVRTGSRSPRGGSRPAIACRRPRAPCAWPTRGYRPRRCAAPAKMPAGPAAGGPRRRPRRGLAAAAPRGCRVETRRPAGARRWHASGPQRRPVVNNVQPFRSESRPPGCFRRRPLRPGWWGSARAAPRGRHALPREGPIRTVAATCRRRRMVRRPGRLPPSDASG